MEFEASHNDLVEAVSNAVNGVPSNPVIPIRAGMWIQAKDGTLTFLGSDSQITFTATLVQDIITEGEVTVPGKLFADIIKSLPGDDVHVTSDGQGVIITSGRSEFKLRAIKDDYPVTGHANPAACGIIAADDFSEAILKVASSADKTNAKPAFTGILLDPDDDHINLVATDSYRLAACEARWRRLTEIGTCLVPAWVLERFRKGINSAEVLVSWDDSQCVMTSGNFTMTTRVLDAEYPKWRAMFPPEEPSVKIDPDELTAVVKRARLAVHADATPVELMFYPGYLMVAAGDEERFSEQLDCDYQGNPYTARVGAHLLQDGINACEGDTWLGFTDEGKPIHLYSGRFNYVLVTRRAI